MSYHLSSSSSPPTVITDSSAHISPFHEGGVGDFSGGKKILTFLGESEVNKILSRRQDMAQLSRLFFGRVTRLILLKMAVATRPEVDSTSRGKSFPVSDVSGNLFAYSANPCPPPPKI